jgi:hypothetical protein
MARAVSALDPKGGWSERAILLALADGAPGRALALGQGDAMAVYADAVRLLGSLARPELGVLTSVADRLAKPAAADAYRLFVDLSGQILRWMVLAKAGRPDSLLNLGRDGQSLIKVTERAQLDRWTALRDGFQASFQRAEALNLDKRHTITDAFLEAAANLR